MGIDIRTLALSKRHTEESLQGAGAVKGKDGFSPTVSTRRIDGGIEIAIQDSTHTETFVIKDGIGPGAANDYSKLAGKPEINGVVLEGNRTFGDLGAAPLSNMEIIQIINKAAGQPANIGGGNYGDI